MRDSEPIIVSPQRVERAAEQLAEASPCRYMPVWKIKNGWRGDGRLDPIRHVETVIRALNGAPL